MTLEEARKVAEIAATADGGCGPCCEWQMEQLSEAFPQFVWRFDGEYGKATVHEAEQVPA